MQLYEENINLQEALIRESKGAQGPTTVKKEIAGIKIPLFVPANNSQEGSKKGGQKDGQVETSVAGKASEEALRELSAVQQLNETLTTKCKSQEEAILKKEEEL